MKHNGKKEVELGHVFGRLAADAEVAIEGRQYRVVSTSAFPGIFGDWFLFGYTVVTKGKNPVVEHLSPYTRATGVKVTRRVFPEGVGLLGRLHAILVDRGWH